MERQKRIISEIDSLRPKLREVIMLCEIQGFTYEEVEKEVFDKIRKNSYNGNYSISVILQFKNSYGSYYDGPPVNVGTLNGSQVKRYSSFRDFSGLMQIYKAFPWNHRYN